MWKHKNGGKNQFKMFFSLEMLVVFLKKIYIKNKKKISPITFLHMSGLLQKKVVKSYFSGARWQITFDDSV